MGRVAIEPGLIAVPESDEVPPRLLGSRCVGCGAVFHPRRPVCLACHGRDLADVELDARGTLHACTEVHMPLRPGLREGRTYRVAHVDLDEGPRVQGLLAAELDRPEIGMRLELGLETLKRSDDGEELVVHHFRAAVADGIE